MKEFVIKNRTSVELTIGIIFFAVLSQIAFIISGFFWEGFSKRPFYYSLGLWTGAILAVIYGIHMYRTLLTALDYDSVNASSIVRKGSLIRYLSLVLILGGLMVIDIISPLSAFLGVMGLKAGAYMQPFVYRFLSRFIGEEERKPLISPEEQDRLYGKKSQDDEAEDNNTSV